MIERSISLTDPLADWLAGLPTCEVDPKSCDVLLATCDVPFCFKSWGWGVHIARKPLFSPQKSTSQLGKTASQVCVSQLMSTENTPRNHRWRLVCVK